MKLAGIDANTEQPTGGEVFMELGNPTGIFNENAQKLIRDIIPKDTHDRRTQALELAINECLKNGITTFHDADSKRPSINLFKEFGESNLLKI